MALERTLSIVKPDGVKANQIGEVWTSNSSGEVIGVLNAPG